MKRNLSEWVKLRLLALLGIQPAQVLTPQALRDMNALITRSSELQQEADALKQRFNQQHLARSAEEHTADNISLITHTFYEAAKAENLVRAGVRVQRVPSEDDRSFYVEMMCVRPGETSEDDECLKITGTYRFGGYASIKQEAAAAAALLSKHHLMAKLH